MVKAVQKQKQEQTKSTKPFSKLDMKALASKLQLLREEKGWTKKEAAMTLGISYSRYQAMEAGKAKLSVIDFLMLHSVFDIDFESLLSQK